MIEVNKMKPLKILIVEDEKIVALDIKNTVKKLGYDVVDVVSSGERAIRSVHEVKPDLILMDIVLKGNIDGIEAAEKILSEFNIPIVYLTAYSDHKTISRAKVTEPFGYILKPFDERELGTGIEIAVYKHEMERKLKESEKWLSTVLKSIGDAVIVTDISGRVVFINPVAEKMLKRHLDVCKGEDADAIVSLFVEGSEKTVGDIVKKVIEKGVNLRNDHNIFLVDCEGSKTPVDYIASPIIDDHEKLLGAVLVLKDISERKEAEEAMLHRLRVEQTLSNVSSRFVGAFNIDTAIAQSLTVMGKLCNATRTSLNLFNERRDSLDISYEWALKLNCRLKKGKCISQTHFPWLWKQIERSSIIYIDDTKRISGIAHEERELFADYKINSLIMLPVLVGSKTEGYICFENVFHAGKWSDDDLVIFKIYSEIIGSALERKRVDEELKSSFEGLYRTMKCTMHSMSKIFENCSSRPSKFGKSPGI